MLGSIVYAITAAALVGVVVVYGAAVILVARWGRIVGRRALWLVVVAAVALALDAVFLRALPVFNVSYGPVQEPWLILALGRGAFLLLVGGVLLHWSRGRDARRGLTITLLILVLCHAGLSAWAYDVFVIEPHDLRTTRLTFRYSNLPAGFRPLRIVHVTDTHVERWTRREAAIAEQVNAFQPDLILLTGDYLNLSYLGDETARRDFRRLVSQWHATLGMYATQGSVDARDLPTLFDDTPVTVLDNEVRTLDWGGVPIHLIGVACTHHADVDVPNLDQALAEVPDDNGLRILLYHSPEIVRHVRNRGLHLFLTGHTHGGQFASPFYGWLVGRFLYDLPDLAGVFPLGDGEPGWIVVSRGQGMEGWVVPRVRWLCPPELGLITIEAEP